MILAAALLSAGCRGADSPPAAADGEGESEVAARAPGAPTEAAEATGYAAEMADICHAEERSGALELSEAERPFTVAQWLGGRVRSDEGRAFLGALAQVSAAAKPDVLDAEAAKLGLDTCPLADRWRAQAQKAQAQKAAAADDAPIAE
ncbi:mucin-associated surface protein (MASP) [Haliangium ochraceum DSM 14365]|uniref:Mucin-associated surface protein (MASP) n=2 Tax=Haliangium ochraceum TaxID=80816 RepID=D0LR96_HALO1|nr:mucin-associated surface protein (MASP) [Haliangium ochraceum DSM 14365]